MRRTPLRVLAALLLALAALAPVVPAVATVPAATPSQPALCDPMVQQQFCAFFCGPGKAETGAAGETLGQSVPASEAAAEGFFIAAGVPDALAADFVASFTGPLSARIVLPPEQFVRYSGVPEGRGSFLTKTLFISPAEAVPALALQVTGNTAMYRQTVVAVACAVVVEGGIFGGAPGVLQTLAPNRDAFSFSTGQLYGPEAADTPASSPANLCHCVSLAD